MKPQKAHRSLHVTSGIVLAAGTSSRMGSLKPLLPLGGKPAAAWAAMTLLAAGVTEVALVVGYRGGLVTAAVEGLPVQVVHNEDFPSGMFSSIQRGLTAISPASEAFFVLPADMPLVSPETVRNLSDAFFASSVRPEIVHPCYAGRRGHPPLISTGLKSEILEWTGAGGLRGYLESRHPRSLCIDVDDPSILMDMDTPEDYLRLIRDFNERFQGKLNRGSICASEL